MKKKIKTRRAAPVKPPAEKPPRLMKVVSREPYGRRALIALAAEIFSERGYEAASHDGMKDPLAESIEAIIARSEAIAALAMDADKPLSSAFSKKEIILFPLGFVVVMVIGCAVWGERPWDWIVSLVVGTGYSLFAMCLLFGLPFWLYGRPRCTKFWKRVLVSALTAYCIAAMVCWDALGRGGHFGRGWDDEWGASRIATTLCAPLNLPTVGVLWMVMKSVKGNAG